MFRCFLLIAPAIGAYLNCMHGNFCVAKLIVFGRFSSNQKKYIRPQHINSIHSQPMRIIKVACRISPFSVSIDRYSLVLFFFFLFEVREHTLNYTHTRAHTLNLFYKVEIFEQCVLMTPSNWSRIGYTISLIFVPIILIGSKFWIYLKFWIYEMILKPFGRIQINRNIEIEMVISIE